MTAKKNIVSEAETTNDFLSKWFRFLNVRPSETKALVWSWLYVFAIFLAYYVLRPIRDELGVAGGVDNLPWLFTGTLIAMLVVNPLFSYAVKRFTRKRFISISYRFFSINLLAFLLMLHFATPEQYVWIGRAFFIWISVFNLFVISVFWSFIVDIFNTEQGKRLFGILAAGATLGGMAGSALTSGFVEKIGQSWLMLASILFLEVALFAVRKLSRVSSGFKKTSPEEDPEKALGGSVFSGMKHTFQSPYLLAVAFYILFNSVISTFLYFQQAEIVDSNFPDRAARTIFFADIDFWVNTLTLVLQVFFAGYLTRWLGVAIILCVLPLVSVLGFSALATYPIVTVFVIVQVARRVSNFGLSRPIREVLFTILSREDRYKAKNFIDTVVYRGGDQVGSWAYAGLIGIGLTMTGISIVAVPLSIIWLGLSFWLGKKQQQIKIENEVAVENKDYQTVIF